MIHSKYVLFNSITLIKDTNGRYLCDPFWAKDLKLHFAYINDLHLCCPVIEADENSDMDELKKSVSYNFGEFTDITDYPLEIVPLHYSKGYAGVLKYLVPNFSIVNKALTKGAIAHTDGAGWPFPLSFYVLPISWFKDIKWLMIIESTFWEVKKGDKFHPVKLFTHWCHKLLLPMCLKAASARIFTHIDYFKKFFNRDENVHIASYTNLDSEYLISDAALANKHEATKTGKARFLLAARLVEEKGIKVLIEAIKLLQKAGVTAQIDIMGSGELEDECRTFAATTKGSVDVSFIDPVPYGPDFFNFIATYDALLLPSLTQEQPRIVFDAYGQGMAIVAADTTGIKTVCQHHENAILFKTGDAAALAAAITEATQDKAALMTYGNNGLAFAKTKTHQQMHKNRADFLESMPAFQVHSSKKQAPLAS